MEFTDEIIAAQILQGDHDLYRVLVQRHERAVRGMGISFFRNKDDAADFTQEVFIKAFRGLSQFKGTARFSIWLYRIAYTTAINRANRRHEYASLADCDCQSAYLPPEDAHLKEVIRKAVQQAVSELPEKYRVCIDLFFFYDRSYEEIEVISGFPVNTVKSHVFRAKKILKEKLKDFVEGVIL